LVWGGAPLSGRWWTLLTGTNLESHGAFSASDRDRFFGHRSIDDADAYARGVIAERLREQPLELAALAWRKAIQLWASDDYAAFWSAETGAGSPVALDLRAMSWLAQAAHLAMLALAVVGCLVVAHRTWLAGALPGADLALLLVAAGTLVHVLGESQGRYHYVLQPFVLVLGAIGAAGIPRRTAVDMAETPASGVGDHAAASARDETRPADEEAAQR
jgi:hypothetical protein